ncbi:unnamed protein product [Fraxinus pennsylvanica]|uniref:Uncharacterized protein n=1 Tax=Fraxinus pennsylvanica TaxID=56036 RepID=A0AAD2EBT0_9LAMI|nr:unnamed protein product [Fraxinus pennsylvanica]
MSLPCAPLFKQKQRRSILFGIGLVWEVAISEDAAGVTEEPERHQGLDKNFGYNKNFGAKYELGKEVGRGHFGHTCYAKGRKGELKDLPLAVKIISKSKVFPCYTL